MDVVLNRRGGVSVRNQIRYQLELKILTGELLPGQRLPSVRAFARRLELHPNTVAGAYKDLEATGHVESRRGAGLFVRPSPSLPPPRANLDETLRTALRQAFVSGYSPTDIRRALERWLDLAPVNAVAVVDPAREMAELLAEEIRQACGVEVASHSMVEVERNPGLLSGALVLALPYHVEALAALSAAATVEPISITVPQDALGEIRALPEGATVLVVSHAPSVLPFAEVYLKTIVGGVLRVSTRPLTASREWRQLLPIADLVVADVLALEPLRAVRPQRLLGLRLLSPETVARLRPLLLRTAAATEPAATASPARAERVLVE
jgi:GntR family transcriptional regulator